MSRASDKIIVPLLLVLIVFVFLASTRVKPKTQQVTPQVTKAQTLTNVDDPTNPNTTSTVSQPSAKTLDEAPDASCHVQNDLPDPSCTPGAVDSVVTQANILQTICRSGYSKSVRPSSSITSKQKIVSMQQYGFADSASRYEYDHLISLELGGAPDDTRNLWPEPGASPNLKDKTENKLHELVCKGSMQLIAAQQRIASNWKTATDGY